MFSTYPSYNFFRTLQLLSPQQQGEDVYALQTALIECGFNCGTPDGILGPMTASAISAAQKTYRLTVDGKAGGATQSALALRIAHAVALELKIPYECFQGQLETESGYRLGAYSPVRLDGTYDAGVAQRNTKYTSPQSGFDAKASIGALGDTIRKHYDLFAGLVDHRRWALAQGAWNAPAFACYLARQEGATKVTASMTLQPDADQLKKFKEYVASASAYLP
jgi:peptidoglycan hydrolase-like protein with peptidoglycan-binding domain